MADDEIRSYGDTGPSLSGVNPTGQGLCLDGSVVAGTEGMPLPLRPVRAIANDNSRVPGICNAADDADAGNTDMIAKEPWRD